MTKKIKVGKKTKGKAVRNEEREEAKMEGRTDGRTDGKVRIIKMKL